MGFVRAEGNALVWERNRERLRVLPWGRDGVRVQVTREAAFLNLPGALLEEPPPGGPGEVKLGEKASSLRNGQLLARLEEDGRLSFLRAATGEPLLEEPRPTQGLLAPRHFACRSGGLWQISCHFRAYDDERLYGLGQHQHGFLNQKGCVIDLSHKNTEVAIPFLLSNRGYGFLWNHAGTGRVELGRNGTCWRADGARQMDYCVLAGATPAEVLERYVECTGKPTAFPEWAAGFWQCKLRYATQDELLGVAREYKRRGLPLSVIVIDFFHWTKMGEWMFDPREWPDPAAMVRELKELGVELMVSVWPTTTIHSANFREMRERGLLCATERGVPVHSTMWDKDPPGPAHMYFYDAMNPEARRYIWEKVRENYYRFGIRVFWLDACEPEFKPYDQDHIRHYFGTGTEVGGLYPLMHQQAFYEGLKAEGEKEVLTLCRSAWAGSQRYGAAVWSGDIDSSFEALRQQIPAGLNMGLSGIPWWTTDIGGFHGGNIEDPAFRELLVRWFQYAVFCPICRLHGHRLPNMGTSGAPNEVWSFGEEIYGVLREQLFLRERLRPYVMEQMRAAQQRGTPPMRPLFHGFPRDPRAWEVEDEFLFGPDVLVAPVTELGARKRQVYLPAGADWRDAWTDAKVPGGTDIEADAPLARIPVYLRGKRTLPFRPS
jgi:alpha-D-xyloside xylohydrolase